MEFREVVFKRKTIREFQSVEIPEEVIAYAIDNAFRAPTYNHLREWDFIIVKNLEVKLKLISAEGLEKTVDIRQLEKQLAGKDELMKDMYLDAIPRQKKMILEAPVVLLVVFKPKTFVEKARRIYDLNCLASAWACIENLLLSLAEHDVFGVTYIPQNTPSIKEKLGIPDKLEIAAVIPIGYMGQNAKINRQLNINPAERIHHEGW